MCNLCFMSRNCEAILRPISRLSQSLRRYLCASVAATSALRPLRARSGPWGIADRAQAEFTRGFIKLELRRHDPGCAGRLLFKRRKVFPYLAGRLGLAEEIALHFRTALVANDVELLLGLHALCGD